MFSAGFGACSRKPNGQKMSQTPTLQFSYWRGDSAGKTKIGVYNSGVSRTNYE